MCVVIVYSFSVAVFKYRFMVCVCLYSFLLLRSSVASTRSQNALMMGSTFWGLNGRRQRRQQQGIANRFHLDVGRAARRGVPGLPGIRLFWGVFLADDGGDDANGGDVLGAMG